LTVPTSTKKRRAAPKRGPSKSKAATSKTGKDRHKPAESGAAPPPIPIELPSPEEEAAFTEMLIETGQAARPDKTGKLPAGATHAIVEDEEGKVKVVRRRFSMT